MFGSLSDWLSWQERLHPSAIDLSLERLKRTLARLSWRRPPVPIITVAGTNGKGSTVAFIAAMLKASGYRVGTFTSPHLLRYNERIRVDTLEVSDASLIAAFERIDAARGVDTLTFFEFNTLAALLIFETAGLDAIVLEVGLGGRLDAVNVVDADVAVITSIALDHCEWLGEDVESIGREKAGILRPGRPAIFGARAMPTSIAQAAADLGSDLRRLGHDFDWSTTLAGWEYSSRQGWRLALPKPSLVGDVQLDNASSALAALECLAPRLPLDFTRIGTALTEVRVAGRFERLRSGSGAEWIVDVAHNPAAAHTLAEQLRAEATSGRTIAICGILGDKDAAGIVQATREVIDLWIVAGLDSPRARDPAELAATLRSAGAHVVGMERDVPAACMKARSIARESDRVIVFGSFLAAGPALAWLAAADGMRERSQF